jgi:hypothetical protein
MGHRRESGEPGDSARYVVPPGSQGAQVGDSNTQYNLYFPPRGKPSPTLRGNLRPRRGRYILGLTAATVTLAIAGTIAALESASSHAPSVNESQVLATLNSQGNLIVASGSYSVRVQISDQSLLFSSQSAFNGIVSDSAYVNFSSLGSGDLIIEHNALTVLLAKPVVAPAVYDPQKSTITGSQGDAQQLIADAETKAHAQAEEGQLVALAEHNTRSLVSGILNKYNFKAITLDFG